jgi:histidinol-phosphatase (PHP family)
VIDLHTHHDRCGHAEGSLADVTRWAAARGFDVLGVSDHAPLFAHPEDHPKPGTQMARSDWDGYLHEASALREGLAGRLDLRVGIEADYLPGTETLYRAALDRPELDYVIGSVHETRGWNLFVAASFSGVEPDLVHGAYWRSVRAAAESGLFDVLAHLDLVRTQVPAPTGDLAPLIAETLDAIADSGVAVEINGSGLRRDGEVYPTASLLAGLVRRGVPISFGSDAHREAQLGLGWDEARQALAGLGVTRLVTFRRREPVWVSIN